MIQEYVRQEENWHDIYAGKTCTGYCAQERTVVGRDQKFEIILNSFVDSPFLEIFKRRLDRPETWLGWF